MPTEVRSPINRKSDDVTLSPGARSTRRDSPDQPKELEADARRSKKPAPSLPLDE